MNIREKTQMRESLTLSPLATLSAQSKGREREEPSCDIRTAFARDRDRILHCNAFRRLKHKTQVFIAREGDHFRERMSHTLEVTQIARTIARALDLNEDLTEAIALGHDLGHTPFGHAGERVLDGLCSQGFFHNEQSLRVVERLEKGGQGLNLTFEVRDGILNHRSRCMPQTAEGQVVRISDKIAYVNHDLQDALRYGDLRPEDIPADIVERLGANSSRRIDAMVRDMISQSAQQNEIGMSAAMAEVLDQLRAFLFERVYHSDEAWAAEEQAARLLEALFSRYMRGLEPLPPSYSGIVAEEGLERAVCDYIAGMSDTYAVSQFRRMFIPGEGPERFGKI